MSKRSPRRRLGIVAVRRNIGAPHKQPVRLRRRILASARGRQSKLRRPCDDRARKASDMRRDTDTAPPGPLAVLLARCCAKRGGPLPAAAAHPEGPGRSRVGSRGIDRVGLRLHFSVKAQTEVHLCPGRLRQPSAVRGGVPLNRPGRHPASHAPDQPPAA
jgi:hypothetical protein